MGESTLRGPASFRAHAVRLIPPLQIQGHSGTAMMIDFSCEDHDMMKTRRRMVVIKSLLLISAQPHPFLPVDTDQPALMIFSAAILNL